MYRVYRALKPGGQFLFDVITPLWKTGRKENTTWEFNRNGGFWSPKPHICLNANYYYGDTAEARQTVVIEECNIRCYNLWDCYFTRQSLRDEIRPIGFSEVCFYEDVAGKPYTDESQTICAIFKKEG